MSYEMIELNGILLKVHTCRDKAKLLEVFTAERGKVFIYARNASTTNKSTMYAWTFAYSKFEIAVGYRRLLIYTGSTLHDCFPELRTNELAMVTGQYFCEITSCIAEHTENPEPYLSLLLNSLYFLTGRSPVFAEYSHVKLVFELGFLQLSGFMPTPDVCPHCGGKPRFWHFDEGFLCSECASKYRYNDLHEVNDTILEAILYILTTPGRKRYFFSMSQSSLSILSRLTEEYLQYKLETKIKTLDVYRVLNSNNNGICQ